MPAPVLVLLGMAVVAALSFQLGYRSLLFLIVSYYYLLAIPGVSAVVYWGDLVAIALIGGFGLRVVTGREHLPPLPWLYLGLAMPLLVYWGHAMVSHSFTGAMVASVRQIEYGGMLIMLISYLHVGEVRLAWYMRASVVLGVIASAAGVLLATNYAARYGLLPPVAQSMSLYVAFYAFALAAWADANLNWSRALTVGVIGLLFALSILSSMSRNLFVLLALGFPVFIALRPGKLRIKCAIIGVSAALAVLVLALSPANLSNRITEIWRDPAIARPEQASSSGIAFRLASWKMATLMWRDHPIAGVGPRAWPAYHDEYLAKLEIDPTKLDAAIFDKQAGAHSEFFQNLAESGVLGMIAAWGVYILACGYAFVDWRRRRRTDVEPYFRASLICAALLVWSYVLGGVTEVYRFAVVPLSMPFVLHFLPEYRRPEPRR
jgi:O-antigen ligase